MVDSEKRMEIIASNIKKLLKERGVTQKKLADDLDLSQSAITAWMKHRNAPTFGVIQDLADYFGVKKTDIDSTWLNLESTTVLTEEKEEQARLAGTILSLKDMQTVEAIKKLTELTEPELSIARGFLFSIKTHDSN